MIPIVSILTLTYNRKSLSQRYIPETISKIGTIPHEVLVWDNGSTDGTVTWLERYNEKAKSIRLFKGTKNLGMEAFNNLAKEAQGKYLIKVDDDVVVPPDFAQRLVEAYETVNEDKLLFFGWDIKWGATTFATRYKTPMYDAPVGKTVKLRRGYQALLHYNPKDLICVGMCRLCQKDKFLAIGGHPEGVIYGVDCPMSMRAARHGYWVGYLTGKDLIDHKGVKENPTYRKFKDDQLRIMHRQHQEEGGVVDW